MIPDLDPSTGRLPYAGDEPYIAQFDAIRDRFATNARRHRLWRMLELWVEMLDESGFPGSLRVGGSYLSTKDHPSDIDVAVAVSPDQYALASKLVRPNAHLWTWQNVGTRDPETGLWTPITDRIQPVLGLVDGFFFRVGSLQGAKFARDWTTEYDEDDRATGVRMGWLEVER